MNKEETSCERKIWKNAEEKHTTTPLGAQMSALSLLFFLTRSTQTTSHIIVNN